MYDHQKMDIIIDLTIREIYLSSKEKGKIHLKNIEFKNKGDLACLYIAGMARNIFGFEAEREEKIIPYWFHNLKHKFLKIYKRARPTEDGIDVERFIEEIEKKNECPGIFKAIYNTYYERHI